MHRAMLKHGVQTLFLGTYIGSIFFFSVAGFGALLSSEKSVLQKILNFPDRIVEVAIASAFYYPAALVIGGIPAFLFGVLYLFFLRHKTQYNPRTSARFVAGAVLAGFVSTIFLITCYFLLRISFQNILEGAFLLIFPSLFSGGLLAAGADNKFYEAQFPERKDNPNKSSHSAS